MPESGNKHVGPSKILFIKSFDITTEMSACGINILQQQYELFNTEQRNQEKYWSTVKLPRLELPKFNGNKMKWREFWDLFKVTVDQNKQLSDIEILIYLKDRLTGEAERAISGTILSKENYRIVVSLLKERF